MARESGQSNAVNQLGLLLEKAADIELASPAGSVSGLAESDVCYDVLVDSIPPSTRNKSTCTERALVESPLCLSNCERKDALPELRDIERSRRGRFLHVRTGRRKRRGSWEVMQKDDLESRRTPSRNEGSLNRAKGDPGRGALAKGLFEIQLDWKARAIRKASYTLQCYESNDLRLRYNNENTD